MDAGLFIAQCAMPSRGIPPGAMSAFEFAVGTNDGQVRKIQP